MGKKIISLALSLVLLLGMLSCPSASEVASAAKKFVVKAPKTISINCSSKIYVSEKSKFKSSNKKILSVNSKGIIKAKKAGKVRVTVISKKGNKKKVVNIVVKNQLIFTNLSDESIKLNIGESIKLKTNLKAGFKSSNKSVAVVSGNGVITATNAGETVITATSKRNKKLKRKIKVTVLQIRDDYDEKNTDVDTSVTDVKEDTRNKDEKKDNTQKNQSTNDEQKEIVSPTGDNKITRIEWIKKLLEVTENECFVTSDDEVYGASFVDVKSNDDLKVLYKAVRKGIIDCKSDQTFNPNEYAKREFVAYSAVRACGFQVMDQECNLKCSDSTQLIYPKYDNVAVRNELIMLQDGMFNPDYDITTDESDKCIEKVKEIWNDFNKSISEREVVVYNDSVLKDEVETYTDYLISEEDGEYKVVINNVDNNLVFAKDKILILPPNGDNPDGISLKIDSYQFDGTDLIIFGNDIVKLEDVFKDVSISGVTNRLEDIKFSEGVTVMESTDIENEDLNSKLAPYEMLSNIKTNELNSKTESNVNLKTGSDKWILSTTVKGVDPKTGVEGDMEIAFELKKPSFDFEVEFHNKEIEKFTLSMYNGLSADLNLEGAANVEFPIIDSVIIPLKYGFKVDLSLNGYISANGKLQYHAEINSVNRVAIDTDNPCSPKISKQIDFSTDFQLEAYLSAGIEPKATLIWGKEYKIKIKGVQKKFGYTLNVADFSVKIGVKWEGKYRHFQKVYGKNLPPNEDLFFRCIDFVAEREMELALLGDEETILNALIKELVDENFDGFHKEIEDSNRIHNHYECLDGLPWEEVEECTRDEQPYDESGNLIKSATITIIDHYVEWQNTDYGIAEGGGQDGEITIYEWKSGDRQSLPSIAELTKNKNSDTEMHYHPMKYKIVCETTAGSYISEGECEDFSGGDLTDVIWFFMGYMSDTNIEKNMIDDKER